MPSTMISSMTSRKREIQSAGKNIDQKTSEVCKQNFDNQPVKKMRHQPLRAERRSFIKNFKSQIEIFSLSDTDCTTLNTSISAREQRTLPRSRNSSWCPGAQTGDYEVREIDNSLKTTLHFSAKIKKKMLYSSSFDALKKSLVGVHKYIQATDSSEASEESVEKQLRSTDRV